MFTGLVETLGRIVSVRTEDSGKRLAIAMGELAGSLAVGESIAINGCCLTVISIGASAADFQAGPETLARTNLGRLKAGERVNLERSLLAAGRLGGHLVQGHVDGLGTIARRQRDGEWETVWFEVGELTRQLVPKGSVAVDGVSLTVVAVTDRTFSVALIPHTLAVTTLGFKQAGDTVNIETDIIGKYVHQYLEQLTGGLSREALVKAGFVQ